jgi:hypothetical protein
MSQVPADAGQPGLLLTRIKKHEGHLGWRVRPDGWVTFSPEVEGAL